MERIRLGFLVVTLVLAGCTKGSGVGDSVAGLEKEASASIAAGTKQSVENRALVELLREELNRNTARIVELEGAVKGCEEKRRAAETRAAELESKLTGFENPAEFRTQKLSIVNMKGKAVLTVDVLEGKASVTLTEGDKTVGPVALEPVLSLLKVVGDGDISSLGSMSGLMPKKRSLPGSGPVPEDYKSWIRKKGKHEYLVVRSKMDEQLSDMGSLARQARIVPSYKDGAYRGFKLISVRARSIYRALGFRSGDVIMKVNGLEMDTPARAVGVFEMVKSGNLMEVEVRRTGKEYLFVYRSVDELPAEPTEE